MRQRLLWVLVGAILLSGSERVGAQQPGQPAGSSAPPAAAAASAGKSEKAFDPMEATRAYLAKVPPEKRARSNAYFEGGYWLLLWDFLYGAAVSILLLALSWSARMRNLAERITRRKPLQSLIYWTQYAIVAFVLVFPLTFYEGYVREHKYGLATQSFGPWFGDQAKGLAVTVILGGVFVMAFYGVLRRASRSWWIWGSAVVIVFFIISIVIAPIWSAPLFNKYTPLEDPTIRDPILSLARANGIKVSEVYVVDASRQSNRVSANVSGFLGTQRISLNDNLLKRCSPAEIEAVMGHEMGHYVLNHVHKSVVFFSILIVLGFAFVRACMDRVLRRWGERWGVRGVGDVAGAPLMLLLISAYFFILTPVTNTIIRTQEFEADMYGLNAAREPDGEAEVDLK
ncbi:MAG TPA: M48 family metallopeptidase, partial [Thermoanaerobaculia bacterium]|nr:M48 family metallopeptidase [Thermoanaerobaculia bacterium]